MTSDRTPSPVATEAVGEAELHAWLDGELPAERCAAVSAYLAAHPDMAARLRRYREQGKLMRRAFEPLLDRPSSPAIAALLASGSRARLWRRRSLVGLAAAALAGLLVTGGWFAHHVVPPEDYVAEAVTAYRLAVIDRIANGVWAMTPEGTPAALERLSRRVGVPIQVPPLADLGFTITAGRLVPASGGATAVQFIYERASGQHLTVYVRPTPDRGEAEVVTRHQPGGLVACSWRDEGIAFVVVSDAAMADVLAVSAGVYRTADSDPGSFMP